jgi:very-short-patch-repair endonuclease
LFCDSGFHLIPPSPEGEGSAGLYKIRFGLIVISGWRNLLVLHLIPALLLKEKGVVKTNYNMAEELHKGAGGKLFWYARTNRKDLTEAEQILWSALRGRKFLGFKFRRQHPIDEFIADFYCHEKKLVIELDGGYHQSRSQAEYDEGRTFQLTELGITIIRFTNEEVITNLPTVLKNITHALAPK